MISFEDLEAVCYTTRGVTDLEGSRAPGLQGQQAPSADSADNREGWISEATGVRYLGTVAFKTRG